MRHALCTLFNGGVVKPSPPSCTKLSTPLPSVSIIVRRVCRAITEHLGPLYIRLPSTEVEVEEKTKNFFARFNFPQCLGAVDGTHIDIKHTINNATEFINRKSTV